MAQRPNQPWMPGRGISASLLFAAILLSTGVVFADQARSLAELAAIVTPTTDRGDIYIQDVRLKGNAPSDQLVVTLARAEQRAGLRLLVARRPSDGRNHGGRLLASLLVLTDPRQPGPAWAEAADRVIAKISDHDRGQYAHSRPVTRGGDRTGRQDPGGPATAGLLPITWLLLLLSLWALPLALRDSVTFESLEGEGRRWRWFVLFAPLLALTLRALAPHRMVMVYFGYLHVEQAVDLDVLPRYGSASAALYHALFKFGAADHGSVQWVHVALGSLSVWPIGALAGRCVGGGKAAVRVAALTAIAIAVLPLSIMDHGSESILVPANLWWLSAMVSLDGWMRHGDRKRLFAGMVLLSLCGLSRPDCMAVALPSVLVLLLGLHPPERWRQRWRGVAGLLVAISLLWLPAIEFL